MGDIAATKLWVDHWLRVGPILEKIEHEELRAFSFQRNWETVDNLLQLGVDAPNAKPRNDSGLVEQQLFFAKARR